MSRFDFCHERKVWHKQCSCCAIDTVGTSDLHESLKIIGEMFSPSNGEAQTWDGFQSRCWICNSAKRRALGIDRQQLEEMMAAQNGRCGICDCEISITRNAQEKANVDHDETSGEVRGLLCGNCNRGIGLFKHDKDTIRRAADYCSWHDKIIKLRGRYAT